ncbi:aldo/keto reductase [Variovorax sp. HJSM1_2]|uniref:aldo/keto reductase n=1 Tax=Variovorax sp. HJSM1_2 TaxID=3366263 RepID=UPI003BDFCC9D
MELRPLGRSGLLVSPICFGGNVFGWTANAATSFSLLDAWFDAGFNFVDTADVYSAWVPGHSGGESETLIGQWLKRSGRRHQMVLATKVGKPMGPGLQGLRPAYIRQAVDASLKRLQTDYIDLYQSHDDDTDTPIEDTLGAYADLIRIGKVRAIGASNYSAPRFAQALDASSRLGLPRYETLQPLYNLYDRAVFEDQLQALCRTHGVGVINFYALAAGFLTGKYRTAADAGKSARGGKTVATYLNPRGLAILQALDEIAAENNTSPAQVATAWLMQRPTVVAPIASATSLDQLQDLVAASQLRLSAQEIARLDATSAQG